MRNRIWQRRVRCLSLFLTWACCSIPQVSAAHNREAGAPPGYSVAISVLTLFHPKEFVVSVPTGHALLLQAGEQSTVIDGSQVPSASIRIDGSDLYVTSGKQQLHATNVNIAGRGGDSDDFILEVPGKIKRRYHGTLTVRPSAGDLLAVVVLDRETAVASVVAAESAAATPIEALKALAITSRSYFIGGRGRHKGFDFCDTTHCQFLRTPPLATSTVAHAVEATRGLILTYKSGPFAAMYTRSCSGQTRTPAQVGIASGAYPYYSVNCGQCRQHPVRWTSYLKISDAAALRPADEGARLTVAKRLGWSAVPSNEFSITKKADHFLLAGVGNGHGIGLCQAGAKAMAESGAGFREILEHYYPNTEIVQHSGRNPMD